MRRVVALVPVLGLSVMLTTACGGGGLSGDGEQAYKLITERSDYCDDWAKMVADGVHQDDFGASWWAMNDARIDAIAESDVIAGGKKAVSECPTPS